VDRALDAIERAGEHERVGVEVALGALRVRGALEVEQLAGAWFVVTDGPAGAERVGAFLVGDAVLEVVDDAGGKVGEVGLRLRAVAAGLFEGRAAEAIGVDGVHACAVALEDALAQDGAVGRSGAAQHIDGGEVLGSCLQRDDGAAARARGVERALRPRTLGGRRQVAFDLAHRRRAERAAREAEVPASSGLIGIGGSGSLRVLTRTGVKLGSSGGA